VIQFYTNRCHTKNIALFSHGQFGGVLATRWVALAVDAAQHFPLGKASISIFAFDSHHPTVPIVALWNASREFYRISGGIAITVSRDF
jgi:broad specificity phosphatase PhoE